MMTCTIELQLNKLMVYPGKAYFLYVGDDKSLSPDPFKRCATMAPWIRHSEADIVTVVKQIPVEK